MHYYQFNIGDYASHTRHLTPMEDLVYRRLLDIYYLHEQPLNECSTTVARLINLRGQEAEVEMILKEFFQLVPGSGWINFRADEEISKYKNRLESASKAGKVSAERRLNARSTTVQLNKNQEPITKNQEKTEKAFDAVRHLVSLGVVDQVAKDYVKQRKKKPTMTAINRLEKEARKANISLQQALEICCARGWEGFNADWIRDKRQQLTGQQSAWLTITGQTLTSEDDYHGRTIEADTIPPALLGK